jgi:hypothetical protein
MTTKHEFVSDADAGFVLSTLEPDQLAEAKRIAIPRRRLRGGELVLLWALRIYVAFMFVIVLWQAWAATR